MGGGREGGSSTETEVDVRTEVRVRTELGGSREARDGEGYGAAGRTAEKEG